MSYRSTLATFLVVAIVSVLLLTPVPTVARDIVLIDDPPPPWPDPTDSRESEISCLSWPKVHHYSVHVAQFVMEVYRDKEMCTPALEYEIELERKDERTGESTSTIFTGLCDSDCDAIHFGIEHPWSEHALYWVHWDIRNTPGPQRYEEWGSSAISCGSTYVLATCTDWYWTVTIPVD